MAAVIRPVGQRELVPAHEAEPRPGTIYSVTGCNTGLEADPRFVSHYPMEAFCLGCDEIIRREQFLPVGEGGDWQHTGRRPGENNPDRRH